MGNFTSTLRTLRIAIYTVLREKENFDKLLDRVKKSPGLPTPNPSTSFWLIPPHPIARINSDVLPKTADVVVIGSGITATALVRTLLDRRPELDIVILDARSVCSGATGRNGGHIKVDAWEFYKAMKKKFGREAAVSISRFRLRHLWEILNAAEEDGVLDECEGRVVEGCDVVVGAGAGMGEVQDEVDDITMEDLEGLNEIKEKFDNWKKEMPEDSVEWQWLNKDKSQQKFGVKKALCGITGPAGAIWPYRLCCGILSKLMDKHESLSLIQDTPVTSIETETGNRGYIVHTSKGSIRTAAVVHATNAYASHLVPGLRAKIIPIRGQMSAQSPPKTLTPKQNRSWILYYGDRGYDYLTQRPYVPATPYPPNSSTKSESEGGGREGGEMMLGGGFAQLGNKVIERVGIANDSGIDTFAAAHLAGMLPYVFRPSEKNEALDNEAKWEGVDIKNMWTGVIGISVDSLPWVGLIPPKVTGRDIPVASNKSGVGSGEWIAAGYSGDGMVNAWGCAHALARLMLGEDAGDGIVKPKDSLGDGIMENDALDDKGKGDWWDNKPLASWFPTQMIITEERVKKASIEDLLEWLD